MTFTTIFQELEFVKKRYAIQSRLEQIVNEQEFIKVETDYFEDYLEYINTNKRLDKSDMVKLQNKSGDILLLRPDITTNIIKQALSKGAIDRPLKLYYIDPIFTYDTDGVIKTVKEFGVEMINTDGWSSDLELLRLIQAIFQTVSIDITLEIGNQSFVTNLVRTLNLSDSDGINLQNILAGKNAPELRAFLAGSDIAAPLLPFLENIFSYQGDFDRIIADLRQCGYPELLIKIASDMQRLSEELNDPMFQFDLSLVMDFDYYNGPIYRGYLKTGKSDILKGGRYDLITKDYGSVTSALGFSIRLDDVIREVIASE